LLLRSGGYVTGHAPESPQQQAVWAYLVALHTALRSGEVLALSRTTVDLRRRVYRLPRHKTDKVVGERLVPFTPRAARVLKVLDAAAEAAGRDVYFTISDQSRDTLWRKVRDRMMIEGLRYHDSRAAALTWLSKRYDVMTLAKISGHTDINELFSTYYRESAEAVAARL
jgi:integrase